jgi:hypothetical protein
MSTATIVETSGFAAGFGSQTKDFGVNPITVAGKLTIRHPSSSPLRDWSSWGWRRTNAIQMMPMRKTKSSCIPTIQIAA